MSRLTVSRYSPSDARSIITALRRSVPVARRMLTFAALPRSIEVIASPCWPCATTADLERDPCERHGGTR